MNPDLALSFSSLVESVPPSGIRRFFDLVQTTKGVISLGVGEPDFSTPWHVIEEAVGHIERGETSYTSNWGMLALREAIADYLKRRFGAQYDPTSEILVTVGVSEGIDIVFRALLNPGDEVVIPQPCYVSYIPMVTLAQGKAVPIDTTSTGLKVTVAQLKKAITPKTKAVFLSYPCNPTGATLTKAEADELVAYLITTNVWVVSDEIYVELTYDQAPVSLSSYPELKDRLILLNGFSKAAAMTGWRIGYVCGHQEFLKQALKIHQYAALCAPIMGQRAAIDALRHGAEKIEEMRQSYLLRRNFVVSQFKELGFELAEPRGAFYVFPSIKRFGLSDEDFATRLLNEEKVAVVPGNCFIEGTNHYIRCCYATSLEQLREAMSRIGNFVARL